MDRQKEETIIKQGPLKHKDTTIRFTLGRWKPRIAVLRSLQAGRLQFVLMDNKRVEKYQAPIEDYAGIWINPKPDGNERYSFSFISERTTDVFAFETEEAMKRWTDILQEKLGRVLTVNITIPYRQHQLKQGLAMLILRDNAIVITTKDQPPKFQCSILIRHIKHYGDFDDGFVFETGNKCPKGENTFLIRCTNNKMLYNLLDSLAKRLTSIQEVISKHKYTEIAIPQGSFPKAPLMPSTHSPSFNFGNLSQFKQNKHENMTHKLRSVSDIPRPRRPLTYSESALPYYNMDPIQENYQNVDRDGQSFVPEVEYEVIPDDPHDNDVYVDIRRIKPKRSSLPGSSNPNYHNLQMSKPKSATMGNPCKNHCCDNEYMNVDTPIVHAEEDNYVNTNIMAAQESVGDSYANIEPISQSAAKHSHETATNYVNLEFTGSSSEHASNDSPLSQKLSSPISNGVKLSHEIATKGQDETDGKASTTAPCNYENSMSLFPAREADGEYENLALTKPPSTAATSTDDLMEYVMMSTGPARLDTKVPNAAANDECVMMSNTKGYKKCVTIKPPTAVTPHQPATASVNQCGPAGGYEDFVPVKTSVSSDKLLPSEPTATEPYKEFVPIKTASSTADTSLSSANRSAVRYEDFIPIKSPDGGSESSEVSTVNDNQVPQTEPVLPYKEFVSIKTHSFAQTSLPSHEPASGYKDYIPASMHTSNSESHSTIENHEDNEEYSRLQFRSKEDHTVLQQNDSAAAYSILGRSDSDAFYSKLEVSEVSKSGQNKPVKASSSSMHTSNSKSHCTIENHEDNEEYSRLQFRSKEDHTVLLQNDSAAAYSILGRSNSDAFHSNPSAQTSPPSHEPASRYEDFIPVKAPSSMHTSNSESHSTIENHEDNEEYSRLQFRSKEDHTILQQNDSAAAYSILGRSNSDAFYSKLEVSEASKSGQNKPQVPSRNLKKPIKLYEASSDIVKVVPALPPRNHTLQESVGSSTPPPTGPKPVVLPKSTVPLVTPPIGPKPGTRNGEELKYCDLEFVGIGQPRFRPRSKQLSDQALPSQHDTYAIVDRDASIGLQLTLEQKKYERR